MRMDGAFHQMLLGAHLLDLMKALSWQAGVSGRFPSNGGVTEFTNQVYIAVNRGTGCPISLARVLLRFACTDTPHVCPDVLLLETFLAQNHSEEACLLWLKFTTASFHLLLL